MIRVDISTAIAIYVTVSLVMTFLLWVVYGAGRRRNEPPSGLERKKIRQCTICLHTYFDEGEDELTVCPQCGSYQERGEEKNDVQQSNDKRQRG